MSKIKYSFTQNLVSAALSKDFTFIYDCDLIQILIFTSVAITEDISISYIDNENGTSYSGVVEAETLNNESTYLYVPRNGRLSVRKGDSIRVQCTSANTTGTIYGTIHVEVK